MPSRRHNLLGVALLAVALPAGGIVQAAPEARPFTKLSAISVQPSATFHIPHSTFRIEFASAQPILLAAQPRPRDRQPPVLSLTEPAEGAIVTTTTISVRGTVTDASPVTVRVEGHRVPITAGAFAADVRLHPGENRLEVEAEDAAGNRTRLTRHVRFEDLRRIQSAVPPVLLAAGLPDLGYLTVAPDGAILVTTPRAGRIYRVPAPAASQVAPDGSPPRVLADHLRHPLGIAVTADGTIYVAERDADRILRIAPSGTKRVVLDRLDEPRGLALGREGRLFITATRWPRTGRDDEGDVHRGAVLRLDLASGGVHAIADGLIAPEGIVAAMEGQDEILWVAAERRRGEREWRDADLFRIAPTGTVTPIPGPHLWRPRGLARDTLGNLWITARWQYPTPGHHHDDHEGDDDEWARGVLFKITPEGVWHRFATGLDEPAGLAFDARGDLFVAEADRGRILRFRAPPAPAGVASSPTNPSTTVLAGTVEPGSLVVARGPAGSVTAPADAAGRFQVSVPLLADQNNRIEVFAVAAAGAGLASAPTAITAVQDSTPPTLTVETPPNNALTNGSPIPVRGQASDPNGPVRVFVNETEVPVEATGAFATTVPLLEEGNEIRVRAADAVGNATTETRTVTLDTRPPTIVLSAPAENALVPGTTVAVSGTVTDLHRSSTVSVNGATLPVGADGSFSGEIALPLTQMSIVVTAADQVGNAGSLTRPVIRDAIPPAITLVAAPPDLTGSRSLAVTVRATDNVTPAAQLEFAFSLDSETNYSAFASSSTFTFTDVADGPHTIRAKAKDQAGNESAPLAVAVRVDATAPSLTLGAAPSDPTNTRTLTVTVTATDNVTPAEQLQFAFSLDSETNYSAYGTTTGVTYADVPDGSHAIRAKARDGAGNESVPLLVTVRVDAAAPTLTLSAGPSDPTNSRTLAVTVSGTDNVTPPGDLQFAFSLDSETNYSAYGAAASATYTADADGPHTIRIKAKDRAGNESGPLLVTVRVDTVVPVVRILTPVAGQFLSQTNLTVTGTVDDPAAVVTVNGTPATISGGLFTATGVAVAAGSAPLTAQAADPAGNVGTHSLTVTVDMTPPTIASLIVPGDVAAGTAVTLSVEAGDNLALAALDLLVDGRLVASGTSSPVSVGFTIPPDKAVDDTLTVTARAVDVAGLATTRLATMRVATAATGSGFLQGLVLDDTKGLPLAGAIVTVTGTGTSTVDPQVTGPDGQYAFTLEPGTALVRITKEGATTVERKVPVRSDLLTAVPDARLAPRDAKVTVLGPAGGTAADQANALRLTIPANALSENASITITPIADQGLIARLPLGWSPVVVADIAPAALVLASPGLLSVRLSEALQPLLPAATAVAVARYDPAQGAWVALDPATVTNDGLAIEAAVVVGGQVAFLLPDPDPLTPPAALAGEPLAGESPAAIPEDATATGTVTPAAIPPGAITAKGEVTVTPTAPLPSGTVVQAVVSEKYTLLSGEEVTPPSFIQELVLYQSAIRNPQSEMPTLSAAFPVTPSKTYTLKELAIGTVHLAVQTPETGGQGTIIGPEGGTLTASDGTLLTIPPGALAHETVVALTLVAESDLRVAIPAGFQVLKAVTLDLTRATLSLSAEMAFPLPAGITADTQVLVARVLEVDGVLRLQAVGVGQVSGGLLNSRGTVAGVSLPGIVSGGTYVALRASTPVGFVAGTITDGSSATKAGVVVSSATGFVDVSRANGGYLLAAAAGSAVITATDRATGQGASQILTVPTGGGATQPLQVQVIPPTVIGVNPSAGATGVPVNTQVSVVFSQAIARASLTGSSHAPGVVLSGPGGPVEVTLTLSPLGTEATLYPAKALASQTIYSLVASQAIQDTHGVPLTAPFTSQFTTTNAPPPPPPAGSLTVSFPDAQGNVTVTATQGTAPPDYLVVVLNVSSGTVASATVGPNGAFTTSLFAMLGDELLVMIQDAAGNQTVVSPGPYRSAAGEFVMTRSGGSLDTPEGITLTLAAAAVTQPTTLKLTALTADQVAASIPPGIQFLGGLKLETQGASFKTGAKVSLPIPSGTTIPPGAQPLLARLQMVAGVLTPVLVDTMRVINGKLTTSSPPFPGVLQEGDYVALLPANPYPAVVTGSVLRDGTTPPQPIPGAIIKVDGSDVAATTDDQGKYAMQLFPTDTSKPATFNLIAVDPATGAIRGASLTVPAWTVPGGGGSYTLDFALPAMGAGRDATPPTITLTVDALSLRSGRVAPGDTVTVTVKATDEIGVRGDTLTLTRNGASVPLPLGAAGSPASITFTPTTPWEVITLVATAQDTSGNVGRAEVTIQVNGGGGGGGGGTIPPPAPSDQPLKLLTEGIFPPKGDSQVDIGTRIVALFNQTVVNASSDLVVVHEEDIDTGKTRDIEADVHVDPSDPSAVVIEPKDRLRYRAKYTLVLKASLQGAGGGTLGQEYESDFSTLDLMGASLGVANPKDVVILDHYAIILDRSEGLVTVDLSDPKKPQRLATTPVFTGPFAANQGFTLAESFTYVNTTGESVTVPAIVAVGWISMPQGGVRGLIRVFDATDPVHPKKIGSATIARCTTGVPTQVLVRGEYAVVASLLQGLAVVDLSAVIGEYLQELALVAGEGTVNTGTTLPVAGPIGMSFQEDAANARCEPGKPKAVVGTWDANGQLKWPMALKAYGEQAVVGDSQSGLFNVRLDILPALEGVQVYAGPVFRLAVLPGLEIPDPTTGEPVQADIVAFVSGNVLTLLNLQSGVVLATTTLTGSGTGVLGDIVRNLLFVPTTKGFDAFDFSNLLAAGPEGSSGTQPITQAAAQATTQGAANASSPTTSDLLRSLNGRQTGVPVGCFAPLDIYAIACAAQNVEAVPIAGPPLLEIHIESDDAATDINGQPVKGIFLIKHDAGDSFNPKMPTIKLTAKLPSEPGLSDYFKRLRKKLGIHEVRWEITLDYRITVPGIPERSRKVGKFFKDKLTGKKDECDGLRFHPHPDNNQGCNWPSLEITSPVDRTLELNSEFSNMYRWRENFVGGGELQVTATPLDSYGSPLAEPTKTNLEFGNMGLVYLNNNTKYIGTKPENIFSPGSEWPRIEGELMYAPKKNQNNILEHIGNATTRQEFRSTIIGYLENPAGNINKAQEIWNAVGHATTRRFFRVIAYKETYGDARYAHFRKLRFNSQLGATTQPPQAVYPSLNAIGDAPPFSTDGGFGLMQLTNEPPTYSQIWHWRKNIDAAIDEIYAHFRRAANFLEKPYLEDPTLGDPALELDYEHYRMETYARYNGLGHPGGLGVPAETVVVGFDKEGNAITAKIYPFWLWDEKRERWVERVEQEKAQRAGIHYAYDAKRIEDQSPNDF